MSSDKQRILILANSTGGLYSFRKEVVQAIVDTGYDVYLSVPDEDDRAKYFEDMGCHILKITLDRRGTNPLADLKLMLAYRKLIRVLKPCAVLTYTIKPNIYGGMACRLTNTPQLANVTGLGDAVENPGMLQKLAIFLYKIGLAKAKCVFFQNSANRDTCIRLGIASKDSVLLPGSGVNLEHHVYQPYPEDDKIKFLYIGRMLRDKGIEEYLSAAKAIKEKYPDTEFQTLGPIEGNYKEQLEELVESGIIYHHGVTHDVRPFIGAVHCTVMPSYHEGMSNVNLESAANGRPVITTDVPGCRETVDDGVTGFLVTARSADSLIQAVERFIGLDQSEKSSMGKAGRKKMEQEFNRQIIVDAYLEEIKKIKNRSHGKS